MDKEIEAAAQWWTQRLREAPSHKSGNSELDVRLWKTAMMTVKPLEEEQIQAFKAALITELDQVCGSGCVICNDYHPDALLKRASEEAKIDHPDMRLPIKTKMTISPGGVVVSQGKDAPMDLIYLLQEV